MDILSLIILQMGAVNWPEIAAVLINGALVMIAVQFLKNRGIPWLKANLPWMIPVLPSLVGSLLGLLETFLFEWLGYPIDFGPIAGLFTGTLTVQLYEIGDRFKHRKILQKQMRKKRR